MKFDRAKLHYLIAVIFIVLTGMLAVLAMFRHCDTNIYSYEQTKFLAQHTVYVYGGLAAFGIGALMLLCLLLERIFRRAKNSERIGNGIFLACGMAILIAGICWISFYDGIPTSDQRDVWEEAQRIAGVLDGPFNTGYFSYFHRNRGITLLVAAAIKVFGNHLYSFGIVNLAASCLAYYSICKAVKLIYQNPVVTAITSLLLMLFYPLVIYTSYHYGTLLSAGFASLGLYAAAALHATGKLRYGVTLVFAFPIGILAHQSAAIGLVAAVLYLVVNARKKILFRNILISAIAAIMVLLSNKMVDAAYIRITGDDTEFDAVPAICTIYMGLTATEGYAGPGSHDGSEIEIYHENDRDGRAASADAFRRVATVMREYLTGKRSLSFFLEKAEYQWLDPSFGARRTIHLNDPNMGDPPNSEAFLAFYDSTFRDVVFKLAIALMLLVYLAALAAGSKTLYHIEAYPMAILIQLYFAGGFAFQLMWESFSRYCFNYFIWLIPEAAFGIYALYGMVRSAFVKMT